MKVHIYCDDRYPDYGLAETPSNWANTVEISEELYAEIIAVEQAYTAMQEKLADLSKQQPRVPSRACRETPASELITQAELDAIVTSAPIESPEDIQAAMDAFNARHKVA